MPDVVQAWETERWRYLEAWRKIESGGGKQHGGWTLDGGGIFLCASGVGGPGLLTLNNRVDEWEAGGVQPGRCRAESGGGEV